MGEPEKAGLIFRLRYESEELQETTNAEASLRILCCVKTFAAVIWLPRFYFAAGEQEWTEYEYTVFYLCDRG